MTREETKQLLPIIQAFAEGKEIECREEDKWYKVLEICNEMNPQDYRIKPEPKYRPFTNAEECWKEMQKHQPFGWIYDGGYRSSIVSICDTTVDIVNISTNDIMECLFSEMIEEGYTFSDGTPFGIKEK